jgi:hypothetical protein
MLSDDLVKFIPNILFQALPEYLDVPNAIEVPFDIPDCFFIR